MSSHFLLKPFLIFAAGILFTIVVIKFVDPGSTAVLGTKFLEQNVKKNADTNLKNSQQEVSKTVDGFSVNNLLEKVLSAVAENPALAPMFKTSREVEQAVNAVRSLPDDQRNSICKQICQ